MCVCVCVCVCVDLSFIWHPTYNFLLDPKRFIYLKEF